MAKIKIKRGGCGITFTDPHGNTRHALKTPESGAFECDNAQADRLVSLGVAAYVDAKAAESVVQADVQDEQNEAVQETAQSTGHLDAAELEQWDYNDLKKLAADMGVTPAGKKKADYITAIVAAEVEAGDEDDELPELNAVDPE